MDGFIRFFGNNKRYIGAAVVGICIVLIAAFGAARGSLDSDEKTSQSPLSGDGLQELEADSDIGKLINDYYTAYASNDIKTLEKLASPISDYEKSYIKFISGHVEKYEVAEIYGQSCESGNVLVSVYEKMHFKDLKSAAPGVDFFYVLKGEDDSYTIDNLYSKFNMQSKEQAMDPEVTKTIAEYEQLDEVVALLSRVQSDYNDIDIKDKDFNKYMTSTLQEASAKWAKEYKKEQKKKEEEEKKKAEEEKKKAEAEKEEEEAKAAGEYVKTKDKVNMRAKASTDSKVICTVKKGAKLLKYGEEDGWTKVKVDGKYGYIKNDFLKKVAKSSDKSDTKKEEKTEEKTEDKTDSKTEDTAEEKTDTKKTTSKKVYVYTKSKVNMRKSASIDADVVYTVKQGKKLRKLGEENGWTQVKFKGKTGYIKSDYISKKPTLTFKDGDRVRVKATVNVRKKRSTEAGIVIQIPGGKKCKVLNAGKTWTKIQYKGKRGFIKTEFIK